MRLIAGAYPAAPTESGGPAGFLARLAESDLVGGLELPFVDDEARWSLDLLPTHWAHVVTAVPATAIRARADADYGLASPDEDGRRAALAVTATLRDTVDRVVQRGATVLAVELQSAPGGTGDRAAFTRSLAEIAGWEWAGARLVVEHCDAAVGTHEPEKGFLGLDDELAAVAEVGAGVGICVNWARSVIETRTPGGAVAHAARAAGAGLLAGLMFSGVADTRVGDFPAWADAHLPPAPHEPASLLGEHEIGQTLAAVSALDFLGVKVGARSGDRTPTERADGVLSALAMVAQGKHVVL